MPCKKMKINGYMRKKPNSKKKMKVKAYMRKVKKRGY